MKNFVIVPLFLLIVLFLPDLAFGSAVDQSFNAYVTKTNGSYIYAVVRQPDGKYLVGGNFEVANGKARSGVARFNSDGTLDSSFVSAVGNTVSTILLLEDGKILVGGSSISAVSNGIFRYGILRLNSDGSLDTSFFNGTGGYGVNAIAQQADGKILIGGTMNTFNGININRIARLNSDGSLDFSFNAAADDAIHTFAVQPSGKILVGGGFSTFNSQPRKGLVLLNSNGSLDSTFTTTVDYQVKVIKLLPDGKSLIAGNFTTVSGQNRKNLARLNADGTLDLTFNFVNGRYDSNPMAIEVQPDGKILFAGLFSEPFISSLKGLYRLNSDGSIDNQFAPLDNVAVLGVIYQTNGQITIGGFRSGEDVSSRVFFAQVNGDGTYSSTFSGSVGTYGRVSELATQPDGKILVGGDFVEVNGVVRRRIARLNADGTLDMTFDPGQGANDIVEGIALQPNGKIILCGGFGLFNDVTQYNLIRLNSDGSVDSSFVTEVELGGRVRKCAVQPDGKIVIAGSFNFYGGVSRKNLARLNNNGSLDTSFDAGNASNGIQMMQIQRDGKILICGQFLKSIARLNADGSTDASFNVGTGAQGIISAFAVQSNGKIIIGGSFSAYNGVSRISLARINNDGSLDPTFTASTQNVYALQIQSNGRIVVGGSISALNNIPQKYLGRLNTDGTFDYSFNVGASADNVIYVMAQQPDGSIITGGSFRKFDGQDHIGIAKVTTASAIYDFDGDGKSDVSLFRPSSGIWYLGQSQAGFAGTTFGQSDDVIVPADYDGDGKADLAVYRSGIWYLQRSQAGFTGVSFGAPDDIPVPADYDGDAKADVAVFRPSNGTWYLLRSRLGFTGIQFGQMGDKPVAADYDGDGRADVAVNRSGTWYINRSQAGFTGVQFGDSNDKLVPADYDGDGKTDIAVFRPSNGIWYLQRSQLGFTGIQFGQTGDLPVAADYDGDGKADVAIFRNGTWYLNRSTQGFTGVAFGAATDRPVPNAFVP